MFQQLHTAAVLLAADPDLGLTAGPSLDSQALVTWTVKTILPIILLVIGVGVIASARGGRISDNANTLSNVLIGCGVIAGAGALYLFAGSLVGLAFHGAAG